MKIQIKIKVNTMKDVKDTVEEIKKIEKEYNCNCTLLDVTVTHQNFR